MYVIIKNASLVVRFSVSVKSAVIINKVDIKMMIPTLLLNIIQLLKFIATYLTNPPSLFIIWPVIHEPLSDNKNVIKLAVS